MAEPPKKYTFDDYCEPCSTVAWCSWHGSCLAECLPGEADAGSQPAKKCRSLPPHAVEGDVLDPEDGLGRVAVSAIREFCGPVSARVVAARLRADHATQAAPQSVACGWDYDGLYQHYLNEKAMREQAEAKCSAALRTREDL